MGKFLFGCIMAVLLAACNTTQMVIGTDGKPLPKEESERIVKNTIKSKVENRNFRILVDEMNPLHAPALHLVDDDWALEIHNDSIGSVLPYFGRGYNMPYGSAMGMHFITRIDSYTIEKAKSDMWLINIACHTPYDSYNFIVEVYDNGQAYISVTSRYRDIIRYSGDVDVRELTLKRVK